MKTAKLLALVLITLLLSSQAIAETGASGGDAFRDTAKRYESKAKDYRAKDKSEIASIYQQMAKIKREAAKEADENNWDKINWGEYDKLNQRLQTLMKSK